MPLYKVPVVLETLVNIYVDAVSGSKAESKAMTIGKELVEGTKYDSPIQSLSPELVRVEGHERIVRKGLIEEVGSLAPVALESGRGDENYSAPGSIVEHCKYLERVNENLRSTVAHQDKYMEHLKEMNKRLTEVLEKDSDSPRLWFFQNDGCDNVDSMASDLQVVIKASDLRYLLKHGEKLSEHLSEEYEKEMAIEGCDQECWRIFEMTGGCHTSGCALSLALGHQLDEYNEDQVRKAQSLLKAEAPENSVEVG